MNIIDHFEQSYSVQRELLAMSTQDATAFDLFRHELLKNIDDEDSLLYPTLISLNVGKKHVKEAWDERAELLGLFVKMDSVPAGSDDWLALLETVQSTHLAHLEEVEEEFLPLLRRSVPRDILRDLKKRIKRKPSSPYAQGAHA